MEISEHIAALRRDGELLADAAARTGLDAAIPDCPGWTQRELLRHIGDVHRWSTVYIADGVTAMLTDEQEKQRLAPAPDDDGALLDWYRDGHAALVDALDAAPADLKCWHFMPAPSPLAFWARRQAHETAIHRVDAQGPTGEITPFDPAFAADGIDELLTGFLHRLGKRLLTDRPRSLLVHATDAGAGLETGGWLVRFGPESVQASRGSGPADCTVRATASDLYLLLWNRRAADGLDVDGDRSVLAHWREKASIG